VQFGCEKIGKEREKKKNKKEKKRKRILKGTTDISPLSTAR
jgi:hypothetical protein